ncbi:MAG TPA: 3-beta hydroxysteroid dehydrogenase [Gammaproteobacteria bacterium]|nr:3-beta hydroxysteroid dehydrogenase [Gammaproteobacteria bacterium]
MSQFELTDKVAIVTGGGGTSHGIGRCIAMTFAQAGAKIVVVGRHEESLNKVVEEINSAGGEAVAIVADITDPAQVDGMVTKAMAAFGQINILVNSAGISLGADIVSTDFDIWKKVHQVNLDSVFLGCKYAVPVMGKYGYGSIINISSISGIVAGWNTAAYNSSKAGVRHLSKSVALYCGKKDIDVRCNSVHPAFVNTPILDPMKQAFGDKEAIEKLSRQIPIKKIGDTDDVAYAILYLASDESKFMTGAEIILDGGLSAM